MNDKNIFINNGLSGIYLLLHSLQEYFTDEEFASYKKTIIHKIESSSDWYLLLNESVYFEKKAGLLSGYCGVSLVYDNLTSTY